MVIFLCENGYAVGGRGWTGLSGEHCNEVTFGNKGQVSNRRISKTINNDFKIEIKQYQRFSFMTLYYSNVL